MGSVCAPGLLSLCSHPPHTFPLCHWLLSEDAPHTHPIPASVTLAMFSRPPDEFCPLITTPRAKLLVRFATLTSEGGDPGMPEGKGPRPHPLTGLTIQVGTLRSLGVNGSLRTRILVQHFFLPRPPAAKWLPFSQCPTQPTEEGPLQMGVRQTPSPLPHPGR